MEDTPLDQLDGLFAEDYSVTEEIELLFIGTSSVFNQLVKLAVTLPEYRFDYAEGINTAAPMLLQNTYPVIFLDIGVQEPVSLSNSLSQMNSLGRIVLVGTNIGVTDLVNIYNYGSIDTVFLLPSTPEDLRKTISMQEARYSIKEAVTAFVSEPPKLSKASFLLLDPKLAEGDENTPLNFVGVMIIHETVPRYTTFFEKTLAQDEYLFAGYLSSITSMGKELFQLEESLKEINFGGISVIFRFVEEIQVAFLVKNLTNFNVEKAEQRIDNLMNIMEKKYFEHIKKDILPGGIQESLDQLFTEFDQVDEIEEERYRELLQAKRRKVEGIPHIIFLGSQESNIGQVHQFFNELSLNEGGFKVIISKDEELVQTQIREKNVAVLFLDESGFVGKSGVFVAESIEELDPSVQIFYNILSDEITTKLIELLDGGNIDYLYYTSFKPNWLVQFVEKAIENAIEIKEQTEFGGEGSGTADPLALAKAKLKGDLESFDSAEKPEFEGFVLARSLEPIYQRFWEVDGVKKEFDIEMFTGLVTSLKQISGEMFAEQENIDALDVGDSDVFVRANGDFLFIYFVKNASPRVSSLIAKEFNAVTTLITEILTESGGLELSQLVPIFDQIASKTKASFTELLIEK